jgi:hypothetical protein
LQNRWYLLSHKQIQCLLGPDQVDTTTRLVNDERKFDMDAVGKVGDTRRVLAFDSRWTSKNMGLR